VREFKCVPAHTWISMALPCGITVIPEADSTPSSSRATGERSQRQ
jgi:hypothetical protein